MTSKPNFNISSLIQQCKMTIKTMIRHYQIADNEFPEYHFEQWQHKRKSAQKF